MTNVGQFFVLGFDQTTIIPASLKEIADKYRLGGVCLFRRNIETPDQVRELNKKLKSLSGERELLISVDQEGGKLQRLKPPHFTQYPSACDVTRENAYNLGCRMGEELSSLGFNMDNAPVLDVNSNPDNPIIGDRSFSADPEEVVAIGGEFIRGMQEAGILACGKHFPGHGDTDQDSHLTLPTVSHSRDRLEQIEFRPFKKLIEKADSPIRRFTDSLRCLMTAHILYPALDPDHPATFSKKIMTDLLRKEWEYDGIVITDDMGMAGAMSQADIPEACIEAFAAGCDLLLVCDHHERHPEIIAKFGEAIRKSETLQKRARESWERIGKRKSGDRRKCPW